MKNENKKEKEQKLKTKIKNEDWFKKNENEKLLKKWKYRM